MAITEATRAGEVVLTEFSPAYNRESITLTGGAFPAGQVLGKITASGKYTAYDPDATDGTETAVAVLFDAVDASTADATGVGIVRGPIVLKSAVLTDSDAAGVAALAAINPPIIVR